ncbi:MAG: TIGR00730 family Rossman fold protein [Bryobacteraceae bacterium]
MKRICVFCGSNPGLGDAYMEAARTLGRSLAESGVGLVYGGAKVGMMGAIADAALAAGGEVVGVMPSSLIQSEIAHRGLTELHEVTSMHERKALMEQLSDGFIAMPGGFGTLDEFCEILTWAQLAIHRKPCGLLNVAGYYDAFLTFLDHAVGQHLLKAQHRQLILVDDSPHALLERMKQYAPVHHEKWITSVPL